MTLTATSRSTAECFPAFRGNRQREQAAAVCYRVGARGIEFLLVRTRSGRWTFPKGRIEPGLSHAQSAALEAFEEAGVHGRIELAAFARYLRHASSKSVAKSILVLAYLCEVRRLDKPQERGRDRTWFTAEKAKRWLQEGRTFECGEEMAAVVDRAAARIRRLGSSCGVEASRSGQDALQKVFVEAGGMPALRQKTIAAAIAGYVRRQADSSQRIAVAFDARPERLLLAPVQESGRRILRLASGSKAIANSFSKVMTIDRVRQTPKDPRAAGKDSRKQEPER